MADDIFEHPSFIVSNDFRRRLQTLEYADKADVEKALAHLLVNPQLGHRRPDGGYELVVKHYALRYSLLDENDPSSVVSLDELRLL